METVTSYVVNRSLANILTLRSNSTKGRKVSNPHCVKSVRIRSYSSPYFPSFGLNTERSVSLHIQSECSEIRTRITPNMDTIYAMRYWL